MSLAWTAGSVRARLLSTRRLGSRGAQRLAACGSLEDALGELSSSIYGRELRSDMSLAQAQQAVWATPLWHLRVLAGWLPPSAAELLRLLAGGFEVANIEDRLAYLEGGEHPAPFTLGRLAVCWPRLANTGSPEQLLAVLSASRWGPLRQDPPEVMAAALWERWRSRVALTVPGASGWAAEASGRRAERGQEPPEEERWRQEIVWWQRLGREAALLVRRSAPGPEVVVGLAALLAFDAWITCAALAAAAYGRPGLEVFDAVA